MIRIRKAEIADLARLVRVARNFFDSAFSADNDPVVMADYMDKAFTEIQFLKEFEEPGSVFFLAEESNRIVAYARIRSNPEVDHLLTGRHLELQRFYLDPAVHGTGLADRLMQECLLHAAGVDWLWLGVWENNVRAVRFYARHGFEKFGTHTFRMGAEDQMDWLMRKRISTAL